MINPANPTCNCYSVAKAFSVTAIGLLYDKGLLKPTDLITDILKKYLPSDIDDKWFNVTIHDVLLHKVGFGCWLLDIDSEDASLYPTNDYLQIVLKTKLKYEPGTMPQYTDAAYYLLSRVVHKLSGEDLETLLRPILMDTMKFKELAWSKCPLGYSIGATGLYIRTEDMVKLGAVYLNNGEYRGKRIVSSEWVEKVLEREYEFKPNGIKDSYNKGGLYGQELLVIPCENRVVGWQGYNNQPDGPDLTRFAAEYCIE